MVWDVVWAWGVWVWDAVVVEEIWVVKEEVKISLADLEGQPRLGKGALRGRLADKTVSILMLVLEANV
jgi:hypothetical protein